MQGARRGKPEGKRESERVIGKKKREKYPLDFPLVPFASYLPL